MAPRYDLDYGDVEDEPEDVEAGEEGDDDVQPAGVRELPAVLPRISWDEIAWYLQYNACVAGLHAVRIPIYVLRVLRWVPVGVGRMVRKLYRWVTDWEGNSVRGLAREEANHERWLQLKRDHTRTIADRRAVVVMVAICTVPSAVVVAVVHPWWMLAAAGGALWLAGWYGAPTGTIIDHVEPASPALRRWDPGVIRRAFEAAGLSKVPRDGEVLAYGEQMEFHTDPRRDGEAGTSCVIDLPLGKTAGDVFKAKPKIASGLRVGKMQLFITPDEDNEGRIELYIHDRDPYRGDPTITPLLEIEKLDFWAGFPFGMDARGNEIDISMLWTHMLVGSMTRYGKTMSARLVGCAAALDPQVRLLVWNGKGDGSWAAFEKVAHRYGNGTRDDVVDHLIATLEDVWEDVQTRMAKLDELRHRVPESKLTRELATDPVLDMPLTLVVIDEVQIYIGDKKPVRGGRAKRGDRLMELLLDIARMATSAGYMLLLSTQRPDAATSKLLTALRDNMATRLCFRVMSGDNAKMILGTVPPGKSPTQFRKGHEGVCVLVGGSDADPGATEAGRIIRTHFADDPIVETILDRAAVLRDRLGTLSGHAAGERTGQQDHVATDRLLDHILQTVRSGEDKLPTRTVLDRLTEQYSDLYHGWTTETLSSHLRDLGVDTSRQINRTGRDGQRRNLRGISVAEVTDALAAKLARAGSNGANGRGNGAHGQY